MMNQTKKKILVDGINLKIEGGQKLEEILLSYTKLTDAEKDEIRAEIK